jgi:hypothetical protein
MEHWRGYSVHGQGVDDPCDDVTHWLMERRWTESQKK